MKTRGFCDVSIFKSAHAFCHSEFAAVFSLLPLHGIKRMQLQTVHREPSIAKSYVSVARTCTHRRPSWPIVRSEVEGFIGARTDQSLCLGPSGGKNVSMLAAKVAPRASEFYVLDEHSSSGKTSRKRSSQDLRPLIDGVYATARIYNDRDNIHRRSYMASYSRGRSSRQSEWVTRNYFSGKTLPSGTIHRARLILDFPFSMLNRSSIFDIHLLE